MMLQELSLSVPLFQVTTFYLYARSIGPKDMVTGRNYSHALDLVLLTRTIHADCNVLRMCKSNQLPLAFPLFGNAEVQEITENMGFCGQMGALIANFAAFVTRLHGKSCVMDVECSLRAFMK